MNVRCPMFRRALFLPACWILLIAPLNVALAHCDFNQDGFQDLAIGIPNEDPNEIGTIGAVSVLYGTSNGLSATNNQFWRPISGLGLSGVQRFGEAVACGDFNGD